MKKALRLVGLFALACGTMTFGATAAQAEPEAHWNIDGTPVPVPNPLSIEARATIEGTHGILLTKVGVSTVEILCTAIELNNGELDEFGRITGRIHISGCITKLNGTTANACKPRSPGAGPGLIETNQLVGLIYLHSGGVDLVRVLPEPGPAFVTLELGALCAIGNKFDITGKVFLKDAGEEGLVEKVEHLIVEGPLTMLLFGTNATTVDGSANLTLAGAHEGLKWSGTAN